MANIKHPKKTVKGRFIVIDGSDGSGKKTQTDLLIKHLKSKKHEVAYYDFPQYKDNIFGKMVGRYLNGEFGEADAVNPYLASLMYSGDRWQAKEKINKDLAQGKIVIANRYAQSNMGYQTAKITGKSDKKKFLAWIEDLEYSVFGIPKADMVIYLYVPYKVAQTLVDQKSKRGYTQMKRDIHEGNDDFMRRVEDQYLALAKIYPEWKIIQCIENENLMSPEEISGLVSKEFENLSRR